MGKHKEEMAVLKAHHNMLMSNPQMLDSTLVATGMMQVNRTSGELEVASDKKFLFQNHNRNIEEDVVRQAFREYDETTCARTQTAWQIWRDAVEWCNSCAKGENDGKS